MKRWDHHFKIETMAEQIQQTCQGTKNQGFYPPQISEWVAALKLLKGIPLSCLTGDEKQLPPESVRFFYIDENWTDLLVKGALSIGAEDAKARIINDFCTPGFHDEGNRRLPFARENRIHEEQRRFCMKDTADPGYGRMTGFLMRSRLVRLWRGLESAAWDRKGNVLSILRMEQLSEEIMICIYQGELAKLRVKEPKEGLRFGTHEEDHTIRVRSIKPGEEGRPIGDKKVNIHTNGYGRADILALTGELKKALGAEVLTSAELAMELIIAPGVTEFDRTEKGGA